MLVVVFDVESVGLHGEGFAAGAVVVNVDQIAGSPVEEFYAACPPTMAFGNASGRKWLEANLPPLKYTHAAPIGVRQAFWDFWRDWSENKGAQLASDCGWPVEANFLSACVNDQPQTREWQGPYPLLDLAPLTWAKRRDPKATHNRLPGELPAHDPLADARQSARLLKEAYRNF